MIEHPNYVFIPDSATEGLRSYREPDVPHPLQLTFLTEAGDRDYVERLRALLSAGRLDEAEAILAGDLAGFSGRMAQLCHATTQAAVTIEGWEDLLPILEENEGPPITAITVGLTNDSDLIFENGGEHEPALIVALYSDDSFPFSTADSRALLNECLSEYPRFAGAEEDVEFYAVSAGLAPLNTALIQSKHRYFLRDGRDGVEGRAPGGYVEYILGTWLRTLRFLQALRASAEAHGLPSGARLIAGTVGLGTDLACILDQRDNRSMPSSQLSSAPPQMAALTMKKWTPRPNPLADAIETGSAIRRKVAAPAADVLDCDEQPIRAPEAKLEVDEPHLPVAPPTASKGPLGFFARLFAPRRPGGSTKRPPR